MKKTVLFLIASLCAFVSIFGEAKAQNSVVAEMSGYGDNDVCNIIKDYKNRSTIISSVHPSYRSTLFAYQYYNNHHVTHQRIIDNYFIYDFEVSNDSVFFCGENIEKGTGVIGFFDINGFFFGSDSAVIIEPFVTNNFKANTLRKLVTYIDLRDCRHIVSIGTAVERRDVPIPCIVDVYTIPTGDFQYYQMGLLPRGDETLVDIAHVNEHVVTAGFTADTNLCLRVYEQHDIFYNLGQQDIRHAFDASTCGGRKWEYGDVLLTEKVDNHFVTAARWHQPNQSSTGENRIHLAEYDVNILLANGSGGMTQSKELLVDSFPKVNTLYQLVNNIKKRTIGILFRAESREQNAWESSIFAELERDLSVFVTGMVATNEEESCPDSKLQGLDTYNSNNNYVMLGYCSKTTYPFHRFVFHIEKSRQASLCRPTVNASLQTIEVLPCVPQKIEFTKKRNNNTPTKIMPRGNYYGITIECSE